MRIVKVKVLVVFAVLYAPEHEKCCPELSDITRGVH